MATERRIRRSARGVLGTLALTLVAGAALVVPLSASVDAAVPPVVFVNGTACTMAGSDANGNQIDSGPGVVIAKLETATFATLQCIARAGVLVNLSGRMQIYKNFQCFIRSPVNPNVRYETYDTNAFVTPTGSGQATCKYSKR